MSGSMDLSGRTALVTGGNAGLGFAIALALQSAGARVAIGARRKNENNAAIARLGREARGFELDVSDESSVAATIAGVLDAFGRLDILVNNAGIVKRESVLTLDRSGWDSVLAVNVTGAFLCTKHAARHMAERNAGKVINIASVYGLTAPSRGRQVSYTVSKHALIGLTRVNAVELAPLGIQVNAVAPGYHKTDIVADVRGTPFEQAVERRVPAGTVLAVDGGYMASDGLDRQ
jgi:2-deoxy-D-gluconate 3-dehydrogenase